MELKKLHMGTVVFTWESMDEVAHLLSNAFGEQPRESPGVSRRALLTLSETTVICWAYHRAPQPA